MDRLRATFPGFERIDRQQTIPSDRTEPAGTHAGLSNACRPLRNVPPGCRAICAEPRCFFTVPTPRDYWSFRFTSRFLSLSWCPSRLHDPYPNPFFSIADHVSGGLRCLFRSCIGYPRYIPCRMSTRIAGIRGGRLHCRSDIRWNRQGNKCNEGGHCAEERKLHRHVFLSCRMCQRHRRTQREATIVTAGECLNTAIL